MLIFISPVLFPHHLAIEPDRAFTQGTVLEIIQIECHICLRK